MVSLSSWEKTEAIYIMALAHGAGSVEFFLYTEKGDLKLVQLFNKRGKVADAAADAIQPVADDKIGRINSHMSEHFLGIEGGRYFFAE